MKTYQQPSTTFLVLSASERLCQEVVTSVGGNVNMKYGGPGGSDYKPM